LLPPKNPAAASFAALAKELVKAQNLLTSVIATIIECKRGNFDRTRRAAIVRQVNDQLTRHMAQVTELREMAHALVALSQRHLAAHAQQAATDQLAASLTHIQAEAQQTAALLGALLSDQPEHASTNQQPLVPKTISASPLALGPSGEQTKQQTKPSAAAEAAEDVALAISSLVAPTRLISRLQRLRQKKAAATAAGVKISPHASKSDMINPGDTLRQTLRKTANKNVKILGPLAPPVGAFNVAVPRTYAASVILPVNESPTVSPAPPASRGLSGQYVGHSSVRPTDRAVANTTPLANHDIGVYGSAISAYLDSSPNQSDGVRNTAPQSQSLLSNAFTRTNNSAVSSFAQSKKPHPWAHLHPGI
jgi:hypothetical protein